MDEKFIFGASVVCLVFGLWLCFLPTHRYLRFKSVGAAGGLLLVMGVVLMTTFKWTEVAIKVSGLEVRIAELQQRVNAYTESLQTVRNSVSPQMQSETLQALLDSYKQVSNTDFTPDQLANFEAALDAAQLTVVPVNTLNKALRFNSQKLNYEPPRPSGG